MHGMIFTDDWRCDQYRWVDQGMKHLPKKMPRVKKSYIHIDSVHGPSADFRRHTYELNPPNNLVLIHYLGDEGAAVDFPHGNQQNESRNFVRTCPSLLNTSVKSAADLPRLRCTNLLSPTFLQSLTFLSSSRKIQRRWKV